MSYFVSTCFDQKSWNLNWIRQAKSEGLKGFIIGDDLSHDLIKKSNDLGFDVIPIERDKHFTLAKFLKKDQFCLFTKSDIMPVSGLSVDSDFSCNRKQLNLLDYLYCIKNLQKRADSFKIIQEKIQNAEGVFSSELILGSWKFWNGFSSFQNYMYDKDIFDLTIINEDLILNLYLALSESITKEDL
jgi:hypothetical protein